MAQFVEFVGNNLLLVGIWIALALALVFYRTKTGAQAVGTQQAVMLINRKDGVVLDIRDKKDYDAGHIVDSLHVPYGKLRDQLPSLEKYRDRPVIVVCKMGQHSAEACKILLNAGFSETVRLRGGMTEWRAQNLPVMQGQKQNTKGGAVKDKPAKTKGKARRNNKADKAVAVEPVAEKQTAEAPVDDKSGVEQVEERRVDEAVAEPEDFAGDTSEGANSEQKRAGRGHGDKPGVESIEERRTDEAAVAAPEVPPAEQAQVIEDNDSPHPESEDQEKKDK